ncbi:FecR family protein [Chitinophaga rhizosphaerae]|uniref:FecR family protein n=1 Tax=Chitinophaga rhizosphaerae TaxID=1864947 RepID=UPI000F7FE202|nr:FecR family protein [Chitinophaga rhizosphaerae]
MEQPTLSDLLDQYLTGTISPEGKAQLAAMLAQKAHAGELEMRMQEDFMNDRFLGDDNAAARSALHAWLQEKIQPAQKPKARIRTIYRTAAAASIILAMGTAAWWAASFRKNNTKAPVSQTTLQDAQPGTYKAKLTLANGQVIVLDSLSSTHSNSGAVQIAADGSLVYDPGTEGLNTISTNKGETFSFKLPDGSTVWLNSASTVQAPAAFRGKERRIVVTGEVFVDVAQNPQQPFIAEMNGVEVRALGTAFNLNSYPDEPQPTATLVTGRVKVTTADKQAGPVFLSPGQQTKLLENGQLAEAETVNIDEIAAWKDGLFHFENASLETVLRQFARWYDIEVTYDGKPSEERKFFGIVRRNNTLQQVLEILKDNDISFKIEGKHLTVTAK